MKDAIKSFVKTQPQLFDFLVAVRLFLHSGRDNTFKFFDAFSKAHHRRVTVAQIGASDGLRWDPVRPFIVRDKWDGILIEPLPGVFDLLKSNYKYLESKSKLIFVNAAVSASGPQALSFWTFSQSFLEKLPLEEQLDYSRKSSINKEHVLRWARTNDRPEDVLTEIKVPCLTLNEIIDTYWKGPPVNLVVIDAEGHDACIIKSINFMAMRPEAVFFENHNLGEQKAEVYNLLTQNGYGVTEIGGDSVALDKSITQSGRLQIGW